MKTIKLQSTHAIFMMESFHASPGQERKKQGRPGQLLCKPLIFLYLLDLLEFTILEKTPRTPGNRPYVSPPGGKKQPIPSNFFQFICMYYHCIIYNKPHCDLVSALTTYLIIVFGGLLERTTFDLIICMAHISACIGANLKNYMRSGKHFSRATFWDQPRLASSIRSKVIMKNRQP